MWEANEETLSTSPCRYDLLLASRPTQNKAKPTLSSLEYNARVRGESPVHKVVKKGSPKLLPLSNPRGTPSLV